MLFNRVKEVKTKETKAEGENSAFVSQYLNVVAHQLENSPKEFEHLPNPSEVFFLQTIQSYNAFAFVERIAKELFIEELYATTYSVNLKVLEALQELQQLGKIGKITLMISDSMRNRNPSICDAYNSWAQSNPNTSIIYSWNHSKITLCKTKDDFFVIEGSGNWSKNAAYEQYIFANSKEAYELRQRLIYECKIVHKVNFNG